MPALIILVVLFSVLFVIGFPIVGMGALVFTEPPKRGIPKSSLPVASFTAVRGTTIATFYQVTFNGSASAPTPPATTLTYEWDFGSDAALPARTATGATPAAVDYSAAGPGTYTVALKVTDDLGNERSTSQEVVIPQPVPTAFFTSASTGSLAMTYTDSSVTVPPAIPTTYAWDFGDAAAVPSTATTVGPHVITYPAAGDYTVRLTITDDNGLSDVYETPITVVTPP